MECFVLHEDVSRPGRGVVDTGAALCVAGAETLLRYDVIETGCCRIITHPRWGTNVSKGLGAAFQCRD